MGPGPTRHDRPTVAPARHDPCKNNRAGPEPAWPGTIPNRVGLGLVSIVAGQAVLGPARHGPFDVYNLNPEKLPLK
jgi:hypothetical protein